jgi:hypothetical protein
VAQEWEGGFSAKAQRGAAHSFDRSFGPKIRDAMVGLCCG